MATAADAKSAANDYGKHLGNQTIPPMTTLCVDDNSRTETLGDDYQLMPGIQLDGVHSFSRAHDTDIHVTPIIVDFRSILLSKSGVEIIKGVS